MADELAKVREGFYNALADLDGIRVYQYAPPSFPNEIPFLTLDRIDVDYLQVVGDGKISGTLRCTLAVQHTNEDDERGRLEEYMNVSGSNSIYELIDADRQLDDNVSIAWLMGFSEANLREINGVPVQAAIVEFGFMT